MFSFGIIAENFEVFENDIFDCKVLWVVGKCEWNSVGNKHFHSDGHHGLRDIAVHLMDKVNAKDNLLAKEEQWAYY